MDFLFNQVLPDFLDGHLFVFEENRFVCLKYHYSRPRFIRDIFQFLYLKQNHSYLSIHCRCYWFLSLLDHIQARLKKLITSHMIFALEWMNIWPIKFPCWSPWSSSCETLNKVCRSKLHDCAVFFLSWTVILSFFFYSFYFFFILHSHWFRRLYTHPASLAISTWFSGISGQRAGTFPSPEVEQL